MKHLTTFLAILTLLATTGTTLAADACGSCPSATGEQSAAAGCGSCPSAAGEQSTAAACASCVSGAGGDAAVETVVAGEAFRNVLCPVSGAPAVPGIQAAHNGIVYNFATEGDRDTFAAAPEKYLERLPNKGEIVDFRNEFCPVSGTPAQKRIFAVVDGQMIHTKCAATRAMLLRSPKRYYDEAMANKDLSEQEIKQKYTKVPRYNNRNCPVTGEPVDRKLLVVHNDVAYYVSSADAQEKLNADPEKYLAKLPNKGAIIDMGNKFCPMKMEQLEGTKLVVTVEGHKIYTGCRACAMAILKEPEMYIAKVEKLMAMPEAERAKLIQPAGSCEAGKAVAAE